MEDRLLEQLAAAMDGPDDRAIVDGVRPLLGDDAEVTVWRPGHGGWTLAIGADRPLPAAIPGEPGVSWDGDAAVVVTGTDETARRLVVLEAPTIDRTHLGAVARLLGVAVGRLVEHDVAAAALQRLANNERIGQLGSYDWHVPTDTNRWSDQLYRIYGEEPQSFNASYERFIGFIHPDDREKVQGIHQQAFATGEPYEMEERIVLADGSERLLWSNGEVIPGPDGAPEHFIGICRDVTEQRAAEAAAARAEEHRREAHDAELLRRAALELNDVVVQGLTSAMWATDVGAGEVARGMLEQTLEDARRLMDDLLVGRTRVAPGAGELRRTVAPEAHLSEELAETIRTDAASAPTGATAGADVTAALGAPSTGRRVVIADDAPDVRFLLGVQLGRLGIEVVAEARNGQEAVDLVAAHTPDLVLLDLSMPVMDGLEATRAIRARHPDITIVILSGYAASTMREPAREAGADGYVEKGNDVVRRLEQFLGVVVS